MNSTELVLMRMIFDHKFYYLVNDLIIILISMILKYLKSLSKIAIVLNQFYLN